MCFFYGRAVVDDVLFPLCQLAEGNIGAHAHLPADVRHQRPHQRVPGGDGAFVDGERFVRNQRGAVHRADDARAAAGAAGALAVEGQLLCGRRIKVRAAFRADQLLSGGDRQRRGQIMSVGAAMAGQAGKTSGAGCLAAPCRCRRCCGCRARRDADGGRGRRRHQRTWSTSALGAWVMRRRVSVESASR